MKITFLLLLSFLSFSSFAADEISKEEVLKTLHQLKDSGFIPKDKIPEIEAKIKNMNEAQFNGTKDVARGIASKQDANFKSEPTAAEAAGKINRNDPAFKQGVEQLDKLLD